MFYTRKRKGLPALEAWFQMPDIEIKKAYTIRSYNNMYNPIKIDKGEYSISCREARTLVSDLSLTEEELLLRCERNVRNEIRRAERDGAKSEHYLSEELCETNKLINQFDTAYAAMHRHKGLPVVSVTQNMIKLAQAGMLLMSVCKIGGEICVYHVYVIGDSIARLLYSVSVFRDVEDNAQRAIIGRGNRLLHYQDMLWLKKRKYSVYDWGGYATDPALASINAFKKGFGGIEIPCYYATTTTRKWIKAVYDLRAGRKRH